MAKCKILYGHAFDKERIDLEIEKFLHELEINGHTFLHMNTISFGGNKSYIDEFRTEIIYQENNTRKVIIEKLKE